MSGQKDAKDTHPGHRVALAGNPNCGKTSIFNALTGARQNVGNYPGVTVEKREGHFNYEGRRYDLLDLPGTYSLMSFSPEERIAQDELLELPDVVVVVADSTALKRALVILAQIMHLKTRFVLCLNMADEARASGLELDRALLEKLLGFRVVETVGHHQEGIDELKEAIRETAKGPVPRNRLVLGERLDRALEAICDELEQTEVAVEIRPWIASRMLIDEVRQLEHLGMDGPEYAKARAVAKEQSETIEIETGLDIALFVTERYYGFVDGLLREVTRKPPRADARAVSDRIDSVLAHRVLGLPVFFAVMYGIFWLTFTVGAPPMDWIEAGFELLGQWIGGLWADGSDSAIKSLIVDGVIGGVGAVIVFLPNIVLLFFGLAILEDTGYMARAAFLVDSAMHRFGLHGRSFIPMITGFGCSIPGIMATRTLENERDRLTTMLVLPLMSCGARLPIWMLLIPAFFPEPWRAPALWLIYAIGIILALVLALLLRRTLFRGEEAPFVMELPPYRLPPPGAVFRKMVDRSWLYLRKAGTVILAISIVMWVITKYPKPESYEVERAAVAAQEASALTAESTSEELRYSIAGRIGRFIEPALRPLGLDWKVGVAVIGAFAAKEVFVAQMGIIYSMGETDETSTTLRDAISRDYSPIAGFALMLLLLIAAPCMATIAVTRRESGSWKWAALQLFGLTALGYIVALIFYQVARLFVG